jgi:hypothetical protein
VALQSLQAAQRGIERQLTVAVDRRQELVNQTKTATSSELPAISQQIAQADAVIAQEQAALATISARIRGLQQTNTSIVVPPPRRGLPIMTGRELTIVSVFFTLAVLMPLTIGLVVRLVRRPTRDEPRPSDPMLNARMERLEQGMDAIAIEIERISEGQRFVTRVLTERPAPAAAAPAGTIDASGLGEPKPFRALGAGPMEPIRSPERQGVRPSITPH